MNFQIFKNSNSWLFLEFWMDASYMYGRHIQFFFLKKYLWHIWVSSSIDHFLIPLKKDEKDKKEAKVGISIDVIKISTKWTWYINFSIITITKCEDLKFFIIYLYSIFFFQIDGCREYLYSQIHCWHLSWEFWQSLFSTISRLLRIISGTIML